MIKKEFRLEELETEYTVLISRIEIHKNDLLLDEFFKIIKQLQNKYSKSIIQFFNTHIVLNDRHIQNAIYFAKKAFKKEINISNDVNIEFLLYLSANRQIKNAFKFLGITIEDLHSTKLHYCIVSESNRIMDINEDIIERLNSSTIKPDINLLDNYKLERIKNYFEISDSQIKTLINARNISTKPSLEDLNPEIIADIFNDLICEKMALLSLEGLRLELD